MNSIKFDAWLSKLIHKDAYLINTSDSRVNDINEIRELQKRNVFLSVKIDVNNIPLIRTIEKLNFSLVDTNIILAKQANKKGSLDYNQNIRFAKPKDKAEIAEIAKNNFTLTRFHKDEYIPPETANKIKEEWTKNFFLGTRGNFMVVVHANNKIAGFNQLILDGDLLTIDLIAVDKNFRNRGLASKMIAYAETNCGDIKTIQVGTQLSNIPSLQLYEKIGFRMYSSKYVYHWHKPQET